MIHFEPWQWAVAAVGALVIGTAKGGVAGLGVLVAAIFPLILPAKAASGFVLPLLVVGDVASLALFRKHGVWAHLVRLFPWTAAGVVAGHFSLGRIDDRQAQLLVGAIVVLLVALHLAWRAGRRAHPAGAAETVPAARWLAPAAGLLAGYTTLVANAAGPVMIVYLLAMRLPKLEFVGTSAWFFFAINLFKVPFMVHLGLVDAASLGTNAVLAPAVIAGCLLGRRLVQRMDQRWFERTALVLTLAAGVKLLWG